MRQGPKNLSALRISAPNQTSRALRRLDPRDPRALVKIPTPPGKPRKKGVELYADAGSRLILSKLQYCADEAERGESNQVCNK